MERVSSLLSTPRSRLSTATVTAAEYGHRIARHVRALAFWLAIPLSAVLVVALLGGLVGERPLLFGALLLSSAVCTVVGHEHVPGRTDRADR